MTSWHLLVGVLDEGRTGLYVLQQCRVDVPALRAAALERVDVAA